MSPVLQSTLIKEDGQSNAIVELLISDASAVMSSHDPYISQLNPMQSGSHGETVFLRVQVDANHNFLSGYQSDAIRRAIAILEDVITKLKKQ